MLLELYHYHGYPKYLDFVTFYHITLSKIFRRLDFGIFLYFCQKNRFGHFMQIVSIGVSLHEMSDPVSWEK